MSTVHFGSVIVWTQRRQLRINFGKLLRRIYFNRPLNCRYRAGQITYWERASSTKWIKGSAFTGMGDCGVVICTMLSCNCKPGANCKLTFSG